MCFMLLWQFKLCKPYMINCGGVRCILHHQTKKMKRLKLFVKFSCFWALVWFFNPFENICNVSKIGYCFMKLG